MTDHRKTIALALAALNFPSKCSFITHKLRFFVQICLAITALLTFYGSLS